MEVNYNAIPLDLQQKEQWVCWKEVHRHGEMTKVPINPKTSLPAKVNDPSTWSNFETAKEIAEKEEWGIGFVFADSDPFCGIDLDHCITNGNIATSTQKIINRLDSYTEVSPSGTGVHVIVKARKRIARSRGTDIEIYDHNRFFTITGRVLGRGKTINPRQDELDAIMRELFPQARKLKTDEGITIVPEEKDIVSLARASKNGEKFDRLWRGDMSLWSGDASEYISQSEADLALCSILSFWTNGDEGEIDRLFRQSMLFRPKWDEKHGDNGITYGQMTIEKATEGMVDFYGKPKEKGAFIGKNEKDTKLPPERIAEKIIADRYKEEDGILNLRYYQQSWWEYIDKKYQELPDHDLRAIISQYIAKLPNNNISTSSIRSVISAMEGICYIPSRYKIPLLINKNDIRELTNVMVFRNGYLKLRDIIINRNPILTEVSPKLFNTIILPYEYQPNAICPKWNQFLRTNLDEDESRINILQEFVGYLFLQDTSFHKFMIIEGEASTGKSTFLDVVTDTVGVENVSNVPLELFGQRFSLISTFGKLANIVSECGELDVVAEGTLKQFVAGDKMQFERKYKEPVETYPTAKLIIATNNLPRFLDRSQGIWRRLILVPFEHIIHENERNRNLRKEIKDEELSGVFNWAMKGLQRLLQNGEFTMSEKVFYKTQEYIEDTNPARRFLLDYYEEQEYAEVETTEIYQSYVTFCKENGYYPLNSQHFTQEVKRVYPKTEKKRKRINGNRYYIFQGLTLK